MVKALVLYWYDLGLIPRQCAGTFSAILFSIHDNKGMKIDVCKKIRIDSLSKYRRILKLHQNTSLGCIKCNLEAAEDFKCVFVVYCVLELI